MDTTRDKEKSMNEVNPKVSVVMSVYNGAISLDESMRSILAQTFTDFELIVINDASTDTTASILKGYEARDPRVKVVTNEHNLGLTKSLNKGAGMAKGEYIARMDADDVACPQRFAKQVAFLDTHTEYGLVGTWADVIDDTGKKIHTFEWESEDKDIRKNLIKYIGKITKTSASMKTPTSTWSTALKG